MMIQQVIESDGIEYIYGTSLIQTEGSGFKLEFAVDTINANYGN